MKLLWHNGGCSTKLEVFLINKDILKKNINPISSYNFELKN